MTDGYLDDLRSRAVASLRVLVRSVNDHTDLPAFEESPERTVFSCPECGTEVVLPHRSTSRAPSQCWPTITGRTECIR